MSKDRGLLTPVGIATGAETGGKTRVSPQDFIEEFRKRLSFNPLEPLSFGHLRKATENYPEIVPFALYNPGVRWALVLQAPNGCFEIYDPARGIIRISDPRGDKGVLYIKTADGGIRICEGVDAVRIIRRDNYILPVEPLRRLGRVQIDSINSGPLAIYAALVAKGRIKSP